MEAILKRDRSIVEAALSENQKKVRKMVLDSYQDMLDGKGRDYREFFAEMERKYQDADI